MDHLLSKEILAWFSRIIAMVALLQQCKRMWLGIIFCRYPVVNLFQQNILWKYQNPAPQ